MVPGGTRHLPPLQFGVIVAQGAQSIPPIGWPAGLMEPLPCALQQKTAL